MNDCENGRRAFLIRRDSKKLKKSQKPLDFYEKTCYHYKTVRKDGKQNSWCR